MVIRMFTSTVSNRSLASEVTKNALNTIAQKDVDPALPQYRPLTCGDASVES